MRRFRMYAYITLYILYKLTRPRCDLCGVTAVNGSDLYDSAMYIVLYNVCIYII